MDPLPDWLTVIQEAQYWHTTPMEIEEWPMSRIVQGQMYRQAMRDAEQSRNP